MSIPTHNPDSCRDEGCTVKFYKTKCDICKNEIYYFECSHGSRAIFDFAGQPWIKHHCNELLRIITQFKKAGKKNKEIYDFIMEYSVKEGKKIPEDKKKIIDSALSQLDIDFNLQDSLF